MIYATSRHVMGAPETQAAAKALGRRLVEEIHAVGGPLESFAECTTATFIGSWQTGSADPFSDIDLQLFLPPTEYALAYDRAVRRGIVSPGSSFLVTEEAPMKTVCKIRCRADLEAELAEDFVVALWIFGQADIWSDPGEWYARLLANYAADFTGRVEGLAKAHFVRLQQIQDWIENLVRRQDVPTLCVLSSEMMVRTLELAFLAERRPYPYRKWLAYWADDSTRLGRELLPLLLTLNSDRDFVSAAASGRTIVEHSREALYDGFGRLPWIADPSRYIS